MFYSIYIYIYIYIYVYVYIYIYIYIYIYVQYIVKLEIKYNATLYYKQPSKALGDLCIFKTCVLSGI